MYVGLMTTKENDIFQAYAGLTLWILGLFCLTTGVATFKQWAAASVMRGVFLFNLFVLAVGLVYFDIIKPITRPINIGSYFRAAIYILMLLGIIVGYRKAK